MSDGVGVVTPDEALAAAILRQRELAAAIEVKESAARARDEAVDAALAAGVTAYRVAQVLGLSQSTVHKIKYRG